MPFTSSSALPESRSSLATTETYNAPREPAKAQSPADGIRTALIIDDSQTQLNLLKEHFKSFQITQVKIPGLLCVASDAHVVAEVFLAGQDCKWSTSRTEVITTGEVFGCLL